MKSGHDKDPPEEASEPIRHDSAARESKSCAVCMPLSSTSGRRHTMLSRASPLLTTRGSTDASRAASSVPSFESTAKISRTFLSRKSAHKAGRDTSSFACVKDKESEFDA